ncbi:hypothetical protein RFI_18794 [Reticulomyxa filosa]|uniref:Dynein heavy chain AAA 5 extension domain-containing protein n=1 Tax=Reticulomyxa filosa TaxID=46433 RepID=X6MWU4_RETFI|nr:hypothetical protein RFI_18794 [Reticulomyxa filosa]|eukprot:ETO18468.1 hypothetical protein RFI_18794 [Reticulomyxa filosa]
MDVVTIHRFTINPKALSMNRLYGAFDDATHEWSNGVLAQVVREASADLSKDRKWVVLDGPVDTLWIENLNTVLDDNKKLCLASGEIIKLSEEMSIVFEVDDLSVASPATISRVGMVYMEPKQLGWRVIVHSYINTLPLDIQNQWKDRFWELFDLFESTVQFVIGHCKSVITLAAEGYVTNLLRLFDCLLSPVIGKDKHLDKKNRNENANTNTAKSASALAPNDLLIAIECWFVFSLIWSVGANTDSEGRLKLHIHLTNLLATKNFILPMPLPKPGASESKSEHQDLLHPSIYDFVFVPERKQLIWNNFF